MGIRFLFFTLLATLSTNLYGQAQTSVVDSLRTQLSAHKQLDTTRVNLLTTLSDAVRSEDYTEALELGQEALTLAQKLRYPRGEANALLALGAAYGDRNDYNKALSYLIQARQRFIVLADSLGSARVAGQMGLVYTQRGDYVPALSLSLWALNQANKFNNKQLLQRTRLRLGSLYVSLGDFDEAFSYYSLAMEQFEKTQDEPGICRVLNGLGEIYRTAGNRRQAIRYYNKAIRLARRLGNAQLQAQTESNLAAVEVQNGEYEQALTTAHHALKTLLARGEYEVIAWTQTILARAHLKLGRPDSAIYYGQRSWNLSRQIGYREVSRDASDILSQAYAEGNDFKQAYRFQLAHTAYNDTLSGIQTRQQLAVLQQKTRSTERLAEARLRAEENRRQRQWLISALIGIGLLGVVAVALWRSNRQQNQANALLRQQQAELKAAQSQLIQSEKMASLGELTAGIAHEIQNPLNFVNNFSEVSIELLDELAQEQAKPARDPDLEAELLTDLKQNLEKISHHGGRASSIVRGMLQHSRASSGQREPTDLNALADEYLRLAYHGLRAKDKTFNAELITHFDTSLGKVNVAPQEFGRVLLNLFNNAFYAVRDRQKTAPSGYRPTVTVRTARHNGTVEVCVQDNGTGMSDSVKDKIFQPFFTTKPTGQGTGLGLSLSYDIITKGHNGTVNVESEAGSGTQFIIRLPT
ncbi:tetratricopeptide repeat protein [Spirosoma soli]|uniref:histidine kinase n=1 Tax=Spirosoma soli TaxID=1770529 RepID=A0ABW5M9Z4_9BACT